MINKIKNILNKIKKFAFRHKIISLVFIIILMAIGYYGFAKINNSDGQTRYILASVNKGMIAISVSGTGQVAPEEEKTIKAKTSGEITYLNPEVKPGAEIAKWTSIATIDTKSAKKAIQEAEESLESAQISLEKIIGENELNPRNKQDAEENLTKSYEDGYNTVSSAFLDLPSIMKDLNEILYGKTFSSYQYNIDYYTYAVYAYNEKIMTYREKFEDSYKIARKSYDACFENYKKSDRYSEENVIDELITESYETSKDIAQAVKDAINLIQFYEDTLTHYSIPIDSKAETDISELSSNLSSANSNISSLFNTVSSIKDSKEALEDTDSDIRTARLTVTQRERTLQEAKDNLADCYIYATMGGVISEVNIKQGDDVSSGASAVTIITKSKIAEITLSEVDVANIKMGNKVTLTFDAIENLTITGEVIEVDSVGTASSGVVSYGIEIAFDTNEDNVKSGMSVGATIITNSKNDVLTVPTTAVKLNDDGTHYVQVLNKEYDLTNKTNSIKGVVSTTVPTTKIVEIGLSDDTNTEITGGLAEGDQVVLRVSATSSTSSGSSKNNSTGNILNTGGGGPPSGGTMIIR
jgi:RND family efflux transporter MFP subunit